MLKRGKKKGEVRVVFFFFFFFFGVGREGEGRGRECTYVAVRGLV